MTVSGPGGVTDPSAAGQISGAADKGVNTQDMWMSMLMKLMLAEGQGLNSFVNKYLEKTQAILGQIGGIAAGLNGDFDTKNPKALEALEKALNKFGDSYSALQKAYEKDPSMKGYPKNVRAWAKKIFSGENPAFTKDMKAAFNALVKFQNDPKGKGNWAGVVKAFTNLQGLATSKNVQDADFYTNFMSSTQTLSSQYGSLVQAMGNSAQSMLNQLQGYVNFATKNIKRESSILMNIIQRSN